MLLKMNNKLKTNKKQKGFSLIELLLVMGLSSLAFLGLVSIELKKGEYQRAEAAGDQFKEVGAAVSQYLAREYLNLATIIPPTGGANTLILPLDVLRGTNAGPLPGRALLPASFSDTNVFGVGYRIILRNVGNRIDALITSDAPVCERGPIACGTPANAIKYDWIGTAMKKMGAASGMTFNNANTMSGFNAGWSALGVEFPNVNAAGLIGYRVSSIDTTIYDTLYLRLDGTSTMRGNLNMGNYDINQVTNINVRGWTNTNNLLTNNIQSGTINNTGDIRSNNVYATMNSEALVDMAAGRDMIAGGQVLAVGDIISGADVAANANVIASLDVIAGRDLLTNRDLKAVRDVVAGNDVLAVRDVGAGRNVWANKDVWAAEAVKAQNFYFTNDPTQAATMPVRNFSALNNVWLSDLLPKYTSRGAFIVTDGASVSKPTCPIGGSGAAKIELIPQVQYTQGRVLGDLRSYITMNNVGTYDQWTLTIEQDQYTVAGNYIATASDNGGSWGVTLQSTTYDATYQINMTALAHIYCDNGF